MKSKIIILFLYTTLSIQSMDNQKVDGFKLPALPTKSLKPSIPLSKIIFDVHFPNIPMAQRGLPSPRIPCKSKTPRKKTKS